MFLVKKDNFVFCLSDKRILINLHWSELGGFSTGGQLG